MNKLWLVLLLLIAGCKSKEQNFLDYINDPKNKITQRIKVGETEATLKLLTDEYRHFRKREYADEIPDSTNGYYYFNMKLEKTTGDKPGKEKILYLDFDMQHDFVMLINGDSISPVICQKIENGKAGSYEYMMAFEKRSVKKEDEDFTVFYHDKIFGMGTIAFVYNQDDIKKIPVLKTKTD